MGVFIRYETVSLCKRLTVWGRENGLAVSAVMPSVLPPEPGRYSRQTARLRRLIVEGKGVAPECLNSGKFMSRCRFRLTIIFHPWPPLSYSATIRVNSSLPGIGASVPRASAAILAVHLLRWNLRSHDEHEQRRVISLRAFSAARSDVASRTDSQGNALDRKL